MSGASLLLAFVTLQRLGELVLARRNTAALVAKGGVEASPEHYPLIVLLHAAWLAGLWLMAWNAEVRPEWLAAYVVLQALRAWVLLTLGRRWTTRIIVLPGERLVSDGPFRWISHPNYCVVAGEIAVLPLALGLPLYALVFSLLNGAVLAVRIRAERRALDELGPRLPAVSIPD
jgi:methyltransferase